MRKYELISAGSDFLLQYSQEPGKWKSLRGPKYERQGNVLVFYPHKEAEPSAFFCCGDCLEPLVFKFLANNTNVRKAVCGDYVILWYDGNVFQTVKAENYHELS